MVILLNWAIKAVLEYNLRDSENQEVVKGIYHLEVDISEMNVCPQAGQFFMLKHPFLTRHRIHLL